MSLSVPSSPSSPWKTSTSKSTRSKSPRKAIEEIFDVKVIKVTTATIRAKEKRVGANPSGMTATRKKAVVKLSADSKNIEIFEGMV